VADLWSAKIRIIIIIIIIIIINNNCKGVVPGGNGTTIHKKHKITHTHTQNNTQHTQLQTITQNYKHKIST
jgi:hypothetical protein